MDYNGFNYEQALPEKYNYEQATQIISKYKEELEKTNADKLSEINEEKHRLFLMTSRGILPPLNAFLGGVVSQEIIKSITNKFMPLNQALYLDFSDVIPKSIVNSLSTIKDSETLQVQKLQSNNKQFNALEILLGSEFLNQLSK